MQRRAKNYTHTYLFHILLEGEQIIVVWKQGLPLVVDRVGQHPVGEHVAHLVAGLGHDVLWGKIVQRGVADGGLCLGVPFPELEAGMGLGHVLAEAAEVEAHQLPGAAPVYDHGAWGEVAVEQPGAQVEELQRLDHLQQTVLELH